MDVASSLHPPRCFLKQKVFSVCFLSSSVLITPIAKFHFLPSCQSPPETQCLFTTYEELKTKIIMKKNGRLFPWLSHCPLVQKDPGFDMWMCDLHRKLRITTLFHLDISPFKQTSFSLLTKPFFLHLPMDGHRRFDLESYSLERDK